MPHSLLHGPGTCQSHNLGLHVFPGGSASLAGAQMIHGPAVKVQEQVRWCQTEMLYNDVPIGLCAVGLGSRSGTAE